ncbi:MAG: hypothetical protein OK455_00395 [Thaumarchaeota archaeon]|nr:hypothetical protein [Nitrososphaerota archaeon]
MPRGWAGSPSALCPTKRKASSTSSDGLFPGPGDGGGGSEKLQLDLAELEAEHIDGLKEMIPVKYTLSLARDFPLQFAQLLQTGQFLFQTLEAPVQLAYPGTFGYRIIAAIPLVSRIAANAPVSGLLSNSGVSVIAIRARIGSFACG